MKDFGEKIDENMLLYNFFSARRRFLTYFTSWLTIDEDRNPANWIFLLLRPNKFVSLLKTATCMRFQFNSNIFKLLETIDRILVSPMTQLFRSK